MNPRYSYASKLFGIPGFLTIGVAAFVDDWKWVLTVIGIVVLVWLLQLGYMLWFDYMQAKELIERCRKHFGEDEYMGWAKKYSIDCAQCPEWVFNRAAINFKKNNK